MRQHNNGLRKLCDCGRRKWAKCSHPWHFNFKPRGGPSYRFSLDAEIGKPIKSKTEAEAEAERIRTAIRDGVFVRASERHKRIAAPEAPATADAVTLEKFGALFVDRQSKPSGKKTWTNDKHMFTQLAAFTLDGARLGDKALGAITEDDLETFYAHLHAIGRAASTRNQYAQLLKASFRWAVKKGYLTRNPISEDSAIKRSKIAQRARRLIPDTIGPDGKTVKPGEERRLLAVANPRLQRIIIAALETGCRRGELLGLQWRDVDVQGRELRVRAENAKDAERTASCRSRRA